MKPKHSFMLLVAVAVAVGLIAGYRHWYKPMRDKEKQVTQKFFPGFNPDRATRIEIMEGATVTVLVRDGSTAWQVDTGGRYPADQAAVERALKPLQDIKRDTLVAQSKSSHETLEVTDKALRVKVMTGNTLAVDLIIGKQGKSYSSCFARLADSDQVWLVSENLSSYFKKDVNAWRDKKIFEVKPEQVKSAELITLNYPAPASGGTAEPASGSTAEPPAAAAPETTTKTYRRTDAGGWEVLTGDSVAAIDEAKATERVRAITNLRATDFLKDATDETAGLDQPARSIKLVMLDGSSLTLLVGKEEDAAYRVRRRDRPQIMTMSEWSVNNVFNPPPDNSAGGYDPSSMLPPPNLPGGGGPGMDLPDELPPGLDEMPPPEEPDEIEAPPPTQEMEAPGGTAE